MALIRMRQLTFTYAGESEPALHRIDLTVHPGAFVLVVGPSGSGKTTLLRLMKPGLSPAGERTGDLLYKDRPFADYPERIPAAEIGMVMQDPDQQIVMDEVAQELYFTLENLGMPAPLMRRRVAEMVQAFGLEPWLRSKTHTLSGGRKQMLNLASVLVARPELLLLDEPASQLDPVAAKEFWQLVARLNRGFGVAVVCTEHRLEDVYPLADRVVCLDGGRVVHDSHPREVARTIWTGGDGRFRDMLPAQTRLCHAMAEANGEPWPASETGRLPLTVKEARDWLFRIAPAPTPAESAVASADGSALGGMAAAVPAAPGAAASTGAIAPPAQPAVAAGPAAPSSIATARSASVESLPARSAPPASGLPPAEAASTSASSASGASPADAAPTSAPSASAPSASPESEAQARQGFRAWAAAFMRRAAEAVAGGAASGRAASELIVCRDVTFRYAPDAEPVLRQLNLTVRTGEWLAILGGNGSGKSTLPQLLAGLRRPERGRIVFAGAEPHVWNGTERPGRVGYLAQQPRDYFAAETLEDDLRSAADRAGFSEPAAEAECVARWLGLEPLQSRHPQDLSGSERQKAVLALLLLHRPAALLLDEPTKGLDAAAKRGLIRLLKTLQRAGVTIVTVTHDVRFAAEAADRCALLFDGDISAEGPADEFFRDNFYYTPVEERILRGMAPVSASGALTVGRAFSAAAESGPPRAYIESPVPPDEEVRHWWHAKGN